MSHDAKCDCFTLKIMTIAKRIHVLMVTVLIMMQALNVSAILVTLVSTVTQVR